MTAANLTSAAVYNTPQLQLVLLQIFAQLQHDRDIARSQYRMAQLQLSREEDRCRKEQTRRMTTEHQMIEQLAVLQAKTQAAVEAQRLLEKTNLESVGRFNELQKKNNCVLSKLKNDAKALESNVQMAIKDAQFVQMLVESRRGNLQRALEHSSLLGKKLLESMEKASYFQRLAEERDLLLKSAEKELQASKDQIKDLLPALSKASHNCAYCGELRSTNLLEEKQKLQQELQLERNRSTWFHSLLAQNVTSALSNLSTVITTYSNNQAICQDEKRTLMKKLDDVTERCEQRNSVMSQKVVGLLQLLNNATKTTRQMSEHVKQTLLLELESVRRLSASLKYNFSSSFPSQLQHLQDTLHSYHTNVTKKVVAPYKRRVENLKKLPKVLNGRTPDQALIAAAMGGNFEELEILLDGGANIETLDATWKMTPLIIAAYVGPLEACKLLVERGANINAQAAGWGYYTPLHAAVIYKKMDIVEYLVEKGANLNIRDHAGKTAEQNGTPEIIAWFNNRSG